MATPAKKSLVWDPFLLLLLATVGTASLLPVGGAAAVWVARLASAAIALLFFFHGAKLSREAIFKGAAQWQLHGLVLASTYGLFPALGLACSALLHNRLDPALLSGVLFLTLLPSTVQASIAFTSIARGNVAAAVCSASLSNLLGVGVTPLLVTALMHVPGTPAAESAPVIRAIGLQLLAPFLAGHLLRPYIGAWIVRHNRMLQPVDQGSVLLVVYSAFSAAVIAGIWRRVDLPDLLMLVVLSAVLLAIVMGVTRAVARAADMPHADAIVLLFCGSKKSLVSGVPMAAALFAPAQVGLIILPLMIFHQLQLLVCAVLANRLNARHPSEECQ